jgi:hypothetical protein
VIDTSAKIKIRELEIMTGLVDQTKQNETKSFPRLFNLALGFKKFKTISRIQNKNREADRGMDIASAWSASKTKTISNDRYF